MTWRARYVLALALCVACAVGASHAAAAPLRVIATTTDLASLSSAVGGDLVAVDAIVPAAADPETYEPRPGDLQKLRGAALVVRIGLGYDYWLDTLVRQAGDAGLARGGPGHVDASTGIPLLEVRESVINEAGHAHGAANPHYWLDPANAVTITASIAEALVRQMPAQRERIVSNRERFLTELRAREARWQAMLAPFAGTKLVAYHNSWPYFARRFRLDIVAFVEPRAGVAPSPAHLRKLIADTRAAGVRAVVHEPYEPPESSRFVARELGVPVVTLAVSTGGLPDARDYLALFDTNVARLAQALEGPGR